MQSHHFSVLSLLLLSVGCATNKAAVGTVESPPAAIPQDIPERIPEAQGEKTLLGSSGPTICVPNPAFNGSATVKPSAPKQAQTAPWAIGQKGVGEIAVGKPIPQSAFDIEGQTAKQLVQDKMRGKSAEEGMMAGLIDMDGFKVMRLPVLDLKIRLTLKDNVFSIEPGPSVRTPDGFGVGSTMDELEAAYGQMRLTRLPEPFHCATSALNLDAGFMYSDCESACAGEGAQRVYIGGYDGPEDELPWGEDP
jgi:hypothetical protein